MTQTEHWLKNIIKIGAFAILFIPFIVADSLYFPFITGKNFTFRIIVEVLLVFWVWVVLVNRKYIPKRSPLLWAVAVFLGVLFLATIFSIDPYKSFWSNAERMEGLFGLFHVFLFFFITASVFNKKDWVQFFFVSIVASLGVALQGLFQGLGIVETNRGNRVDAEFGNSTYLSMYNVFHFFFALFMISRIRLKQYVPLAESWKGILVYALGLVAVLHVIVLWFTNTRGAILGFLGGLFLALVLVAIFSKGGKIARWSKVGVVVVVLIPILFFAFKNTNFVQESPVLNRFASISLTEPTTESRLTLWGMTIEAWKDKPVLGWGPGNFTTIFAQYYEPKLWKQEPWFDRPHNVSLQWLVDSGVIGFLAYHTLFVVAIMAVWQLYRRRDFSLTQASIFIGLLAAYFIHNFFVFDNVVSYLLFFGVLGYLHTKLIYGKFEESKPRPQDSWLLSTTVTLVTIGVFFSLYSFNIKPIKAANSLLGALRAGNQGNVAEAHEFFENAISQGTFMTTEAREQLGTRTASIFAANSDNKPVQDLAGYAVSQLETQIEEHPNDMRSRAFLSSLYLQTGLNERALAFTQETIELAPTRQLFYFLHGDALRVNGDIEGAIEAFKTAYELDPSYPRAIARYFSVLLEAVRSEEAEEILETPFGEEDIEARELIAQAYMATRNYAKAAEQIEYIVAARPSDVRNRINLAQLYIFSFQDEAAVEQFEVVAELDPSLKAQTENVISQIREGTIDRNPQ